MSAAQRRKGAAGEREAARALARALGVTPPARNLSQARDGGHDLTIGPYTVEVKRRQRLGLARWMEQAVAANRRQNKHEVVARLPAVLCREDNGAWLFTIRLDDLPAAMVL